MFDGDKIEILEKVLKYLRDSKDDPKERVGGLCFLIRHYSFGYDYYCYFKDFTRENAKKIANCGYGTYWWSLRPYDFDNRIKFVSWMIERIRTGKEGTDVE